MGHLCARSCGPWSDGGKIGSGDRVRARPDREDVQGPLRCTRGQGDAHQRLAGGNGHRGREEIRLDGLLNWAAVRAVAIGRRCGDHVAVRRSGRAAAVQRPVTEAQPVLADAPVGVSEGDDALARPVGRGAEEADLTGPGRCINRHVLPVRDCVLRVARGGRRPAVGDPARGDGRSWEMPAAASA